MANATATNPVALRTGEVSVLQYGTSVATRLLTLCPMSDFVPDPQQTRACLDGNGSGLESISMGIREES